MRSFLATLTLVLHGLCFAGCSPTETRLEIQSFKNPEAAERFAERFDRCSFAVNAQNNWDIVFEIQPTLIRMPVPSTGSPTSTSRPASDRDTSADEVPMSQMIHVHVFWRPVPGTTYAESTQTNATIVYCVSTGRNSIAYKGAGFVYFTPSRDGLTIEGQIESSDLVPTDYVNEPVDLFGPCRIEGSFIARQQRGHVVAILQRLRKTIGPPGGSTAHTAPQ